MYGKVSTKMTLYLKDDQVGSRRHEKGLIPTMLKCTWKISRTSVTRSIMRSQINKRSYCTSGTSTHTWVPAPNEWLLSSSKEVPLRRAALPLLPLKPDYAKQLKTTAGAIPHLCIDEASFLINYDAYTYVKVNPLFQRKVIHGSKCNRAGDSPFIWLPFNHTLYLMQSLPMLARSFHEQNCCLPRLTIDDLAISGAGSFRLRNTNLNFRELTEENMQDVYNNIRVLLMQLIVASHGPDILRELPLDLMSLFDDMQNGEIRDEYRICFHSFFIPLSNKCHALLMIIDMILALPFSSQFKWFVLKDIVDKEDWQFLVKSNEYLKQWYLYKEFFGTRNQFIRYLRAVLAHKLDYGLPAKFVDFLVYAMFRSLLSNFQEKLLAVGMWKELDTEELYLHHGRPGFEPPEDICFLADDEYGDDKELIHFGDSMLVKYN